MGLGETAAELTDHLECPLAIAPRGLRHRKNPRLERVGAGFEDGPESLAALELAAAITLMAGANLAVHAAIDHRAIPLTGQA